MCLCFCMRVCLFFMPLDIYYNWRTILVVDSDEVVSGMTFTLITSLIQGKIDVKFCVDSLLVLGS